MLDKVSSASFEFDAVTSTGKKRKNLICFVLTISNRLQFTAAKLYW